MITEMGIATMTVAGALMIKNRKLYRENSIFKNTCKVKNKNFYIMETRLTDFGTEFIISLKDREFKDLEALKDILQANFKAEVEIELNINYCTATVRVIKNKLDSNVRYKPFKVHPYEVYLGLDNHFKPIIVNLNQYPHVLISGTTGSGKSQELKLLLTNLIACYSSRDINIYFSNISESNDFRSFFKCSQVKGYTEKMDESLKMFEYMNHIYSKRLDIFKKYDVADIKEYNNKYHNMRMSYQYMIIDEFADYFPSNKLEEDYETKVKCYNVLKHLVRKGRKAGIFLVLALQRSDTTVLDPSLKSNLCTKISFAQLNKASSLVICDSDALVNLQPREFIVSYGNNNIHSKSLYINDSLIVSYVKESISDNTSNVFLGQSKAFKEDNKDKIISMKKAIKTKKKNTDEVASDKDTRVKNIEVIQDINYRVENGKILLSYSKQV